MQLQRVQNAAVLFITRTHKFDRITPVLLRSDVTVPRLSLVLPSSQNVIVCGRPSWTATSFSLTVSSPAATVSR